MILIKWQIYMLTVFIWFQTECEVPVSSRRSASPHWHSLLIVWRPVHVCPELSWAGSTDPTGRPTGEVDSSVKISARPIYRQGRWCLEFFNYQHWLISFFSIWPMCLKLFWRHWEGQCPSTQHSYSPSSLVYSLCLTVQSSTLLDKTVCILLAKSIKKTAQWNAKTVVVRKTL